METLLESVLGDDENDPDGVPEGVPESGEQTDRRVQAKLTAYSFESCWRPSCTTRSGTRARWGVVAVDPRVIPLGSRLLIDGLEGTVFHAEDTGGGVRGSHIDIWFNSTQEAIRFGVQHRAITILED